MTALVQVVPAQLQQNLPAVPWGEALQVFLDRQSAPGTRRAYESAVREAFAFLGVSSPTEVAPGDLARYRAHLVQRAQGGAKGDPSCRPLSPGSVAQRLAALRGFWSFCHLTGVSPISREIIAFTLAGYSATVIKPYDVLSEAEQERMLEHLRESTAESAERDYTLLMVMLGTGLRAAEVVGLQVRDIVADDDGDWSLHVRQGKGRKDRLVPLGLSVREAVGTWLRMSGRALGNAAQAQSHLFFGQGGIYVPLSTERLRRVVRAAALAAGIRDKAISPHSLRHSTAVGLLRRGASVITVQKILGHASVQTTQRYLDHLDYREIKRWRVEL
jgi:integrase/recombinase XerD